jgi:hypothetical protein
MRPRNLEPAASRVSAVIIQTGNGFASADSGGNPLTRPLVLAMLKAFPSIKPHELATGMPA